MNEAGKNEFRRLVLEVLRDQKVIAKPRIDLVNSAEELRNSEAQVKIFRGSRRVGKTRFLKEFFDKYLRTDLFVLVPHLRMKELYPLANRYDKVQNSSDPSLISQSEL